MVCFVKLPFCLVTLLPSQWQSPSMTSKIDLFWNTGRERLATTVAAATEEDKRLWISPGTASNYGPCVKVWAPGTNIQSASRTSDTATEYRSGTSQAAPFVAGMMALHLQNNSGQSLLLRRQASVACLLGESMCLEAAMWLSKGCRVAASTTANEMVLKRFFSLGGSGVLSKALEPKRSHCAWVSNQVGCMPHPAMKTAPRF